MFVLAGGSTAGNTLPVKGIQYPALLFALVTFFGREKRWVAGICYQRRSYKRSFNHLYNSAARDRIAQEEKLGVGDLAGAIRSSVYTTVYTSG
jgi:hypothetical protein